MLAATDTGAVVGVDGLVIRVEVDLGSGIKAFRVVGLPDAAVREAQARVRSALSNGGFSKWEGTVTVNLAPADVRKQGSGFDLAVALCLIVVLGEAPRDYLDGTLFLGELALDGTVRPVRGTLAVVSAAAKKGLRRVVVPRVNAAEASLVTGLDIFPVGSLREAVEFLSAEVLEPRPIPRPKVPKAPVALDLADVKGQRQAKRALEIAAAGGHNLLMTGPPGAGKSLLAMRLPSLLPPLGFDEALEVTRIHSVAGLLEEGALVESPPFRAPHHTISTAAMVGGAGAMPGEVSLAHRGVLFLDELAEFQRPALESLRQPLEEGRVCIRRVERTASLPSRFTLVAAMNPCPCGYRGADSRPCQCTPGMVHRYQAKISGPLLDRIDLRVPVRALASTEMLHDRGGESSEVVRARVMRALKIQKRRFRKGRGKRNAFMTPRQITRHCALPPEGEALLAEAVDRLGLSARAFHRILKVARTIADLAGAPAIEPVHLHEAVVYRAMTNEELW